jgi:PAS domain S-box-containing protein
VAARALAHLAAVALVALTLWLRLAFAQHVAGRPVLILFFLPILLAAYFGGLGPGLTATAAFAAGAAWFLFPPLHSLRVERPLDVVMVLVASGVGALMSWLIDASRRSSRALAEGEAVRRSDARLRNAFDNMMEGCVILDRDWRYLYVNEAAAGYARRPVTAFAGRTMTEMHPGIEATPFFATLRRCMELRVAEQFETEFTHLDGSKASFQIGVRPVPEGLLVVSLDVTERRRAGQALAESHAHTRAIVDTALDGVVVMDHEGRIREFSPAAERVFGRARVEVLGRALADVLIPEHLREAHRRGLARYLATGEAEVLGRRIEVAGLRADGSKVALELSINRMPGVGPPLFAGFVRDITERKRAEAALRESQEALRESQEHYRTLAESLPHLVWTCEPRGPCDYLSRQWVEYTGRPAEEQLGYGWAEQLHPDDRERVRAEWAKATERGDTFDVEFRIRRADGVYRWFKTRALPLRDASGRIVKWFGSNTDFEDLKQAQQTLQVQLARSALLDRIARAIGERQDLRSIFQVVIRSLEDQLPIDFGAVCAYDAAHQALTVSSVGVKSHPLALELALTEQARVDVDLNGLARCLRGELVYEPDTRGAAAPFPQRLARGGLLSLVVAPLLVESRAFGVLMAARREAAGFSDADCEFLRGLSGHIALAAHQAELYGALERAYQDLRQTQQAVMQQERLRALGQMASGVAHDINNAISPAALYTESLLEKEPLSQRAREYLGIVQHALDDVAATVGRMREFYRQREPQLRLSPLRLDRMLRQVAELTRARWHDMPQQRGAVIELVTDLPEGLPPVLGVESEIREALVNLVFNAVDAMPDGGTLTLRARGEGVRAGAGADGPSSVVVEVCDTGVGMDEETRRRCLEPFFTTKGDRGTGLGLAIVYGAMQRHAGEVEVASAPGAGTIVRLTLPAAAAAAVAVEGAARASPAPTRLRILVVDDDPLVLKAVGDALHGDGHVVLPVGEGRAGIEAFVAAQRTDAPFDAVITDLGMPYVDGRQVAAAVKAAAPRTPVVLLTGWGHRLLAEGDVPPEVDVVLNKPPKLRELRDALARVYATREA